MHDFTSRRIASTALLLGATVLTPFLPSGALAQETPAKPILVAATGTAPETTPEDQSLGDIIVTATRRAESVQKVPISIQALSGEELEQRQVKGLSDYVALLPSVSFEGLGPGRQSVFFRGIVPAGGNYASVGYYLDDIPIFGVGVPDIHVYDVRIEALSGPQGTLYGAGSLAGTIRFVTNAPKIGALEYGYDVEGNKYGDGNYGGQFQSYVNVRSATPWQCAPWAITGTTAASSTIRRTMASSTTAVRRC